MAERKVQRFVPVPYREFRSPVALARWVECSWCTKATAAVNGYPVRPDGCLDLFYSHQSGIQVIRTMTAERRFDLAPGSRAMGIRFRSGMAGPLVGKRNNVGLFIELDDFDDLRKRLEGYPITLPERQTFYCMVEIGVTKPAGNTVISPPRKQAVRGQIPTLIPPHSPPRWSAPG